MLNQLCKQIGYGWLNDLMLFVFRDSVSEFFLDCLNIFTKSKSIECLESLIHILRVFEICLQIIVDEGFMVEFWRSLEYLGNHEIDHAVL